MITPPPPKKNKKQALCVTFKFNILSFNFESTVFNFLKAFKKTTSPNYLGKVSPFFNFRFASVYSYK